MFGRTVTILARSYMKRISPIYEPRWNEVATGGKEEKVARYGWAGTGTVT